MQCIEQKRLKNAYATECNNYHMYEIIQLIVRCRKCATSSLSAVSVPLFTAFDMRADKTMTLLVKHFKQSSVMIIRLV